VVEAVTAWQVPVGTGWIPATDMPDYQDDAFTILAKAITEMCTIDPDVQVCPRVAEGRAGQVLVDAAEGADLLVVGSRGHAGLTEALLGSVGQYCVHHAPRPVVIMRGKYEIPPRGSALVGGRSCWWERLGVAGDHLTRLGLSGVSSRVRWACRLSSVSILVRTVITPLECGWS
jgi:hypothetical protein